MKAICRASLCTVHSFSHGSSDKRTSDSKCSQCGDTLETRASSNGLRIYSCEACDYTTTACPPAKVEPADGEDADATHARSLQPVSLNTLAPPPGRSHLKYRAYAAPKRRAPHR